MASRPSRLLISRTRIQGGVAFKAPRDVREISRRLGFTALDMDATGGTAIKLARSISDAGRLAIRLGPRRPADVVITQYPLGLPADRLVPRWGRAGRVALVHDLEALRYGRDVSGDLRSLSGYDTVIAHTPAMRDWLTERLPASVRITVLGIFDFLLDSDPPAEPRSTDGVRKINIVGNLAPDKAGYVYGLEATAVPIDAYGPGCDTGRLPPHVRWRGVLDSSGGDIGGFGLVWDGEDANELAGPLGRYLQVNAPHKLSFYVTLGLPVLIPREAAMAPFVVQHGIGLPVDSVADAAEQVRHCSDAEFDAMREACLRLRRTLVTGGHTVAAITDAVTGLA